MRAVLCAVTLLCVVESVVSKEAAPKVQVYSRKPGEYGRENVLICHVSQFHPPEITVELLKNGEPMTDAKQTDLAFEENWHYHLTKHATFIPQQGDTYTCRVVHMGTSRVFDWERDM